MGIVREFELWGGASPLATKYKQHRQRFEVTEAYSGIWGASWSGATWNHAALSVEPGGALEWRDQLVTLGGAGESPM
jgi:hypothetical protein